MPRRNNREPAEQANDPTLDRWRAEDEEANRKRAEEEQQARRASELARAFDAAGRGMPDLGDNRQSALAYAGTLGQLGRLLTSNPDLVHRPLEEIKAKANSPKAYALRVLAEAATGNKVGATQLLLDSWQANPVRHGEVLDWLAFRLRREVMGTDERADLAESIEGPAQASDLVPYESGTITLKPGGFVYRGKQFALAGKAWKVLREFINSRFNSLTAGQLRDNVWGKAALSSDQNVKDAISKVRRALRKAWKVAGVEAQKFDPIPCVDHSPDLAWELKPLP